MAGVYHNLFLIFEESTYFLWEKVKDREARCAAKWDLT